MKGFQLVRSGIIRANAKLISVKIQPPQLAQKSVNPIYPLRIPRLGLLKRTEKHFIHSQGIGTILFTDLIRIDYVEHRFAHFFNRIPTYVFSILKDKLSIVIIRHPRLKGLHIKSVIIYNIDIDMDLGSIVSIFQSIRNKSIGILDSVNKIGPALYHPLINQLLEWLQFTYI